ncbi:MAG: GspE/PulE family protein [bacterium]
MKTDIPELNIKKYDIKKSLSNFISEDIAKRYEIAPLARKDNQLEIAMTPPFDLMVVDDIEKITGLQIKYYLASKEEIYTINKEIYQNSGDSSLKLIEDLSELETEAISELNQDQYILPKSPIVKMANKILEKAIKNKASDVHIEPQKDEVRVRFRIDGVLNSEMILPKYAQSALISRYKIMADLDITKRKLPQDGRINYRYNTQEIDMRISTIPVIYGEKLVIRILNKDKNLLNLTKLGFRISGLKKYIKLLSSSNGIILVTGPTGSGKTTTLFSGLKYLNSPDLNIISVEDPIEYEIKGINQIQTAKETGFSYSQTLRSLLRQDPDIIMIGEIRDKETAQIAVRAALTGHLVLSTLHTNDAISSIIRLENIGIPSYLVAATLKGVIAQRLVRKLCRNCGTEEKKNYIKNRKNKKNYKSRGCEMCNNTGYKGRTGIYEILEVNDDIRNLILKKYTKDKIKNKALQIGMKSLEEDAKIKVKKGITTTKEVKRVIQ